MASYIEFPNIFIASIELEGLNPEISIRENDLNYSKTIFNIFIYLEYNNKKVNYFKSFYSI